MNLFSGRINRRTYIIGMPLSAILTYALLFGAYLLTATFIPDGTALSPLVFLLMVSILILSAITQFSLMVRRLHDFNASGFWSLVAAILPFAAIIFMPIKGTTGKNSYGEQPGNGFSLGALLGTDR